MSFFIQRKQRLLAMPLKKRFPLVAIASKVASQRSSLRLTDRSNGRLQEVGAEVERKERTAEAEEPAGEQ